jgi:(S)-2-hydroxyglutarate dehydrogenase
MPRSPDFAIVGGGVVGLSIARALALRGGVGQIVVFEKEPRLAAHASGRNSGVLHSGIYYAEGSLKARICAEGAKSMAAYCDEHRLPIRRVGKLILPTRAEDGSRLEMLQARGKANGAHFELVDEAGIREIEPDARSADGRGLYNAETAVVEPAAVVEGIAAELRDLGVTIRTGCRALPAGDRTLSVDGERVAYGHLINAAGAYADRVAQAMGVGDRYRILPFKGAYYKLRDGAGVRVNGLIYPVPDLRIPVLGVHSTRTVAGGVYFGPTASPAMGRENYRGLQGFSAVDAAQIAGRVAQQYLRNAGGFRRYLHTEAARMVKPGFVRAARALVPRLNGSDLVSSTKVGIRAQLMDREKGTLEMDFVIEPGPYSTHVLNAISPAFTCSFAFADLVVDKVVKSEK